MRDPGKISLKPFFVVLFIGLALVTGYFIIRDQFSGGSVSNFEECVEAGNPVMESYPEQCQDGDRVFVNTQQLSQ